MTRLRRRFAAAVLAPAGLLCLSACLESYEEEMVIHADLSGRAVVKVGLPDAVASKYRAVHSAFERKNIEKRFAALKGVTLKSYTITEGRFPEARFEIAFASLEKLGAAAATNKPAQILVGEFKVDKDESGRTIIERKLGNGTATAELPYNKYALFKTHFQHPIEIAGTDSRFKDSSHNDVRYRWALADIAEQKPSMVNKVMIPLPWLMILGGAGALVFVAWVGWMLFGTRTVRGPAPPRR